MKTLMAVILLVCATLAGCASGPKKADPRVVYIWPLDTCPSEAAVNGAGPRFAAAPAILAALGGDLINAALAVPFAALNKAAQADAGGFSVSNSENRNFYTLNTKDSVTAPGCFIIAYAAPGGGKSWCDDPSFNASVPRCKTADQATPEFDTLPVREPLFIASNNAGTPSYTLDPLLATGNDIKSHLALPDFYVELAIRSSPGASNIVALEPVAMFYPRSLLNGDSCSQENGPDCSRRLLTVTISLQGATAGSSTTAAKFGVVFPAIAPSPLLTNTSWSLSSSIAWAALPLMDATAIKNSFTAASFQSLATAYPKQNAVRVYPIILSVTLTEAKDPNIYLQALNSAFNQQAQTQLATAITNGISFGGMPSADAQTAAKAASQVLTDQASVATAQAALYKDCATPQVANTDLAVLISKEKQANLDATLAGQPQPYPDLQKAGTEACKTAKTD